MWSNAARRVLAATATRTTTATTAVTQQPRVIGRIATNTVAAHRSSSSLTSLSSSSVVAPPLLCRAMASSAADEFTMTEEEITEAIAKKKAQAEADKSPILPKRGTFRHPDEIGITELHNQEKPTDPVYVLGLGALRKIWLNRPKALNALNLEMVREMSAILGGAELTDHVGYVLVNGHGKAFCAGGDVVTIHNCGLSANEKDRQFTKDFFREEYFLNYQISRMQTPYCAVMDGIVMGGGVGISVHARFRIATEKSMFAMPETAIGFFPDVGGSYFLPRLDGALGMYLALTGARLKGADLCHAGIATHFMNPGVIAMWEETVAMSEGHEEAFVLQLDALSTKFSELPPFTLAPVLDDIDACFSGASVEAIIENLEVLSTSTTANEESKTWASKTLKTMSKMSPTAMKVTYRQIVVGATLPLDECLQMEYRISQAFMTPGSDFYTGVNALLIAKTGDPKWSPDTLAGVSDADVDRYFAPLPEADELKLPDLKSPWLRDKNWDAHEYAKPVYDPAHPHNVYMTPAHSGK